MFHRRATALRGVPNIRQQVCRGNFKVTYVLSAAPSVVDFSVLASNSTAG